MKVILFAATSIDGYITNKEIGITWVKDEEQFMDAIKKCKCAIMGRKTWDEFYVENGQLDDFFSVVMTKNTAKLGESAGVIFTDKSPKDALNILEEKGY